MQSNLAFSELLIFLDETFIDIQFIDGYISEKNDLIRNFNMEFMHHKRLLQKTSTKFVSQASSLCKYWAQYRGSER